MIAAYYKHVTQTLNQQAALAKIQSLLQKDNKKLLKSIRKLGKKINQVEQAEKYIKQLMDKGCTSSFLETLVI